MIDRLLVDVADGGWLSLSVLLAGESLPQPVGEPVQVALPLGRDALEDLRWYLEDYLRHPYAVYSDRGSRVAARLPEWGEALFRAVFGPAEARAAHAAVRARGNQVELVFRSMFELPWELMVDPARGVPLALDGVAITRNPPVRDLTGSFPATGRRLRVLMVISRPAGDDDVGYQMIARPLMGMLDAVRGNVDLVVLRPPTLDHLRAVLTEPGEPFHVVHFDGHGTSGDRLVFERAEGGPDRVPAGKVAQVLAEGRVPVVVLNACRSGQVGAVAARLVQGGAASVVAMAYSVYAVAAAEFMAAFYERLFAGDRVAEAVAAGRARLALRDRRPSPRGRLPLADWVVPVHYARRDVSFPNLRTERSGTPLNELLDRLHAPAEPHPEEDLAPVGTFVGRDDLFHTLESAARLQKVVILHGSGGTGKTELAKAFGRWWRDTGGVGHPDWVIWHSFEPGVSSFGLEGVINGIGLRMFGAGFALADSVRRLEAVRQVLREQRLLLIWDNFESVHTMPGPASATPPLDEAELDELRRFLHEPGLSSVLITSRNREEWLGDLRRVEVGGLNAEEAVLYADRLLEPFPKARRRRETPAFAELMEWLDGHPLSMRLTLPHLDTTDPDTLLAGLRGVVPLPDRDDGDRRTSLTAGVAYSFGHLPERDQRALVAVALFHGVVDVAAVAWMSQQDGVPERFAGLEPADWLRMLNGAAAVGLLAGAGEMTYRIHPALPAYLSRRWRAERSFAEQHAATMYALLDSHALLADRLREEISGADGAAAVAALHLQVHNLGNLLGYALEHRIWNEALGITQALDAYWRMRGMTAEARCWTDRIRLVLEAPDGSPPDPESTAGRFWMFVMGSEAARRLDTGQLDQAHDIYTTVLRSLRGREDSPCRQEGLATMFHQLGVVAERRERWDEAERWYLRSLAVAERLGDKSRLGTTYHQLGITAEGRGLWDDAERWHRRSLALHEELGDRTGQASSYHQLGIVAAERERWDEAGRWYRRSLAINENVGDLPRTSINHHQLGMLAQELRRWDEAERWYLKSLVIRERLGDRPGLVSTYHQLGAVAGERGRFDEAEQWYLKSLALAQSLGIRRRVAAEYLSLGLCAAALERPSQALTWTVKCVAYLDEITHPVFQAGAHFLKTLTARHGLPALEQTWQSTTGRPLPPDIRAYILEEPPCPTP
ncbi:tetratricopeptide repeat protein [Nonomuraea sp. NPDC050643]|uniref:CHAT domain-containing tetratricopeptide repeat protein n=1 Tax=Nonomuraea sp. NPDC050643 TaxID=3155660 RepID=UPI0034031C71